MGFITIEPLLGDYSLIFAHHPYYMVIAMEL